MTKYRVDTSDPPFPRIVKCEADHYAAKSFSDAKRELIGEITYHIEHWREQLRIIRSLRKEDVDND